MALYALFCIYFFCNCIQAVAHKYSVLSLKPAHAYLAQYLVPLAGVGVLALLIHHIPPEKEREAHHFGLPAVSTPLTDILERELAITPGSQFRGRVVDYIPHWQYRKPGRLFHRIQCQERQ